MKDFKLTQEEHDYLVKVKKMVKDIPSKKWIKNRFTDYEGACCILGHVNRLESDEPDNYENAIVNGTKLRQLSGKIISNMYVVRYSDDIATINNYIEGRTPINGFDNIDTKQNVMDFLNMAINLPIKETV